MIFEWTAILILLKNNKSESVSMLTLPETLAHFLLRLLRYRTQVGNAHHAHCEGCTGTYGYLPCAPCTSRLLESVLVSFDFVDD